MARCLGDNPPYGCGHFQEHQEAARKGWHTRRHGAAFRSTDEHRHLSKLFGSPVEAAHEHPEHKGLIRFKQKGQWYELPRSEFQNLAREGKKLEQEEERARKKQARDDAEYEKAEAQRVREGQRETEQKQRQAERDARAEARVREDQERQQSAARRAQHADIIKAVKRMGGIRPNRLPAGSGKEKPPEYEEWQDLPKQIRVNNPRDTRKGVALDDAAATIEQEFLGVGIHSGDDLQRYLRNERQYRHQAGLRRGREEPTPEKPRVVVSQTAGGKWIITRLYKDGSVAGQPGTYPSRAAAEKAAASMRAHGGAVVKPAMFGEREESYGQELFS